MSELWSVFKWFPCLIKYFAFFGLCLQQTQTLCCKWIIKHQSYLRLTEWQITASRESWKLNAVILVLYRKPWGGGCTLHLKENVVVIRNKWTTFLQPVVKETFNVLRSGYMSSNSKTLSLEHLYVRYFIF